MNTAGRSQAFVGLEVRPFEPLQADTVYTATVKRVQSASGIPMVGEYTWQFKTENSQMVQNVMAVETSYYYFGSQRVALRISGDPDPERNGLFYIHTDHLGSTTVLSYGQGHPEAGEEVPGSRAGHLPFGEYWAEPAAGLSDRGFTGHRENAYIKLVDMKARWYSAEIGRFIQPDAIIPDPADPQSFNRFSYVNNRPLTYRDPSGHAADRGGAGQFSLHLPIDRSEPLSLGEKWKIIGATTVGVAGVAILAPEVGLAVEGVATAANELYLWLGEQFVKLGLSFESLTKGAEATCAEGVETACADGDCTNETVSIGNAVRGGLNAHSRAAESGIKSYRELGKLTEGTGLQRHHIVEARFAETLGLTENEMLSAALTPQEHQAFTNAWRALIGYSNSSNPLNTVTASAQDIWNAAQAIYAQYPGLLEAARLTIFGNSGG
jgi:RHS repeat-associated protein